MPPRERRQTDASRRAAGALMRIGEELRNARLQHGLTQERVGAAVGTSRSRVSRIERGLAPALSVAAAIALCAAVGLELSVKAYPGGQPVRDSSHLALIAELRRLVPPTVTWQFERPLPIARDQRAWDVVLGCADGQVAVEVETRPKDLQALLRRLSLKQRDDPSVDAVVLLLADTRHNRSLVRHWPDEIAARYPMQSTGVRAALADGRIPGNGVLLLGT